MTKNFSRKEFACHDQCGLADPHPLLVCGLQLLMDLLPSGLSCIVRSGSRCDAHNSAVGGRERQPGKPGSGSRHLVRASGYTEAADIVVADVPIEFVLDAALQVRQFRDGGMGLYIQDDDWIHLDVRGYRARWGMIDKRQVRFGDVLQYLETREK